MINNNTIILIIIDNSLQSVWNNEPTRIVTAAIMILRTIMIIVSLSLLISCYVYHRCDHSQYHYSCSHILWLLWLWFLHIPTGNMNYINSNNDPLNSPTHPLLTHGFWWGHYFSISPHLTPKYVNRGSELHLRQTCYRPSV